jgi:hypothetical protein
MRRVELESRLSRSSLEILVEATGLDHIPAERSRIVGKNAPVGVRAW